MRLLPMLAPMAQKIVRVDAHHQAGRRRVCSDRIEVSAAVARGASERIDGSLSRDSVRRRGFLASAKVQKTSSSRSQAQTRQNSGGQCFGDLGRPDLPRRYQHTSSRDVVRELDCTAPGYDFRLDTADAQGFISRTLPSSA